MPHVILVIEDEKELREMMAEVLEMNGYSVVTAAEGKAALDAMARIPTVSLVLLDLLMPGMNGWDFHKELRALPAYAHVPVVVHSSAPSAPPADVNRVLTKPVDVSRLLEVVRQYCAA